MNRQIAVVACAAACFIVTGTLPAFLQPEAPTKISQRTLTFAERVAYQRAIEDVYWRNRIWPRNGGERPDAKPSLDAVMPQAQLEKKVSDYLRKSQALEDYWQRPITAEQLQAEIDRMAKHTKQPELLRELFAALGNDPLVVAECLARPALADRLLANWYAYDQQIHGEVRQRAEAKLLAHPAIEQMKQLSGTYREIEFVKSESAHGATKRGAKNGVELNNGEWEQIVQKLAATIGDGNVAAEMPGSLAGSGGAGSPGKGAITQIKTGILSPLREDESCYYATTVIAITDDHLKLATSTWPKEALESWLDRNTSQGTATMSTRTAGYVLPKITEGAACTDDSWTATLNVPSARAGHSVVWTGSEMIVWGGVNYNRSLNTGDRYDPATDSWSAITLLNAPQGRAGHTAVWTGAEMIVWGGSNINFLSTGARYNPLTDSWTATNTANVPHARGDHTAIWTGSEMIVWGGWYHDANFNTYYLNTGSRYNPVTNSWTSTSTTNAPTGRYLHTAIWTGNVMIAWGGSDDAGNLNTGGRYNPTTNSWTTTSTTNAPPARAQHTAVWTGNEMIVWGGSFLNTGGRYKPSTNTWIATSTANAPTGRYAHTAVWTGNEMIVWGGGGNGGFSNTGGRFSPATNTWMPTSATNRPEPRIFHSAVWTGSEMIVFGGDAGGFVSLNTGGRYRPDTNTWVAVDTTNAPAGRGQHSTVWTGSEAIVWGGALNNNLSTNTGGRYDPALDSWNATTTTNAPDPRYFHTAIWTGSEMIAWGGDTGVYPGYLNTGGRYNPATNSWLATNTSNAPDARRWHTAVWSGSEMIIWGGESGNPVNTGGRYNPNTNAWIPTSTMNAPDPRIDHTAIWTGSEMIVWGGGPYTPSNSGGRYNPSTDSWISTSTATPARSVHTAVWTGSTMIVWGGSSGGAHVNTGARYDPFSNSWSPTTTTNAPDGRVAHAAVWTGSEMIVWGGYSGLQGYLDTGGRYDPATNHWSAMSTVNAPSPREVTQATGAVWTGTEMIVWGGYDGTFELNTGGRYCGQLGPTPSPTPTPTASPTATATPTPTPTPTPCTGRCSPTPRPHISPAPRP